MTVHAFGTDSPAQEEHPPASSYRPSLSPDLTRVKYGALLIVAAFLFLGGVFGVAVSRFAAASDVTAVVGSVTTVVGTIVGAFFGVQAGSSGKEAAEAGRVRAEQTARQALARLEPHAAADLMRSL